jgi:hypothetical protein
MIQKYISYKAVLYIFTASCPTPRFGSDCIIVGKEIGRRGCRRGFGLNRRLRVERALFRRTLSEKVILFPGEIVNERLTPASAIDRFLQWKADAVVIHPSIVGERRRRELGTNRISYPHSVLEGKHMGMNPPKNFHMGSLSALNSD